MASASWWDGDGEPGACLCGSALGGAWGGMKKQPVQRTQLGPSGSWWALRLQKGGGTPEFVHVSLKCWGQLGFGHHHLSRSILSSAPHILLILSCQGPLGEAPVVFAPCSTLQPNWLPDMQTLI